MAQIVHAFTTNAIQVFGTTVRWQFGAGFGFYSDYCVRPRNVSNATVYIKGPKINFTDPAGAHKIYVDVNVNVSYPPGTRIQEVAAVVPIEFVEAYILD